jgi:histidinol-phosphate/aromatic aminotransferase/cobyric acid decarboxylase-like protein
MSGALHGGKFWQEVGADLNKLSDVVRAEVLDAWFPPALSVVEAMRTHAAELCRTSPEATAGPLRAAISRARQIPDESILTGGGSSALIYLAFQTGLAPQGSLCSSTAIILDPMYGEYAHVLTTMTGQQVIPLRLDRKSSYRLDPARLLETAGDLVVLVNPNSPTGQHVSRSDLLPVVEELSRNRVVWIDETYIDYVGGAESMEKLASVNRNVIVCKSMSKVYALSGLRVAYLVSHPDRIASLAAVMPPWSVGLPGQVCGALALEDPDYYAARYRETATLRGDLKAGLEKLGNEVTEGVINCLLCHLPDPGALAADVCREASRQGVYLRDAGSMGSTMGNRTVRISVRPAHENARTIEALQTVTACLV